jgi:hypothetical protein
LLRFSNSDVQDKPTLDQLSEWAVLQITGGELRWIRDFNGTQVAHIYYLLANYCSLDGGKYLLNEFIATIRDLVKWKPDVLRTHYLLSIGSNEALEVASRSNKARAAKFSEIISEYFKTSIDYNKARLNSKKVLTLFGEHFVDEDLWADRECHSLALSISVLKHMVFMSERKSCIDVFCFDTGVPLDPIVMLLTYITLEGTSNLTYFIYLYSQFFLFRKCKATFQNGWMCSTRQSYAARF